MCVGWAAASETRTRASLRRSQPSDANFSALLLSCLRLQRVRVKKKTAAKSTVATTVDSTHVPVAISDGQRQLVRPGPPKTSRVLQAEPEPGRGARTTTSRARPLCQQLHEDDGCGPQVRAEETTRRGARAGQDRQKLPEEDTSCVPAWHGGST